MLLIIINVQLFSKIYWKILPPMIIALKFFYTVTIRWYNLLLLFNKSWSSTRACPRSIIVSIIYKWSAKLLVLIQVYTICRWQYSFDIVCWRKRSGIMSLNNVNNWLTLNRICLNLDKIKYMISSYRKLLHLTNIVISKLIISNSWE